MIGAALPAPFPDGRAGVGDGPGTEKATALGVKVVDEAGLSRILEGTESV